MMDTGVLAPLVVETEVSRHPFGGDPGVWLSPWWGPMCLGITVGGPRCLVVTMVGTQVSRCPHGGDLDVCS